MRKFAHNLGIRNPKFKLFETFEESNSFLQKLECSVIVKPIDSNCSRGVNIADRFTYSKNYLIRLLSGQTIIKAF